MNRSTRTTLLVAVLAAAVVVAAVVALAGREPADRASRAHPRRHHDRGRIGTAPVLAIPGFTQANVWTAPHAGLFGAGDRVRVFVGAATDDPAQGLLVREATGDTVVAATDAPLTPIALPRRHGAGAHITSATEDGTLTIRFANGSELHYDALNGQAECTHSPSSCTLEPPASGPVHPARDCDWRITYHGLGGGAGVRFAQFEITNASRYTCRLGGVPTVRLLDPRGHAVAARQVTDTSVQSQLKPLHRDIVPSRGWAHFVITIGNDPSERGDARTALRIRLPHVGRASTVLLRARPSEEENDHVFDPNPQRGFSVTRIGF